MPEMPPPKILIVDDHAALRGTVRQMFEGFEFQMLEAMSGEEAIVTFTRERPDWVIMDLRMPGMGGIKATEAIRQFDSTARVIIISQFTEPEYHDQARKAGAHDFVGKEDMSHLVEIIRRHPHLQP